VNVDEADVGQVRAGQSAQFTVDAYPDRTYPAQITRVGLGSQTSNGVVSYLTILKVDNADLSLRPGMTATAEITTLSRDQVLLVANAALRWSPPVAAEQTKSSFVGSLIPRPPSNSAPRAAATTKGTQQNLWVLGADGQPQPVAVTVGPSDGRVTQITAGALKAGQAVVTDSTEAGP
jgi:HlyD family secretion protein